MTADRVGSVDKQLGLMWVKCTSVHADKPTWHSQQLPTLVKASKGSCLLPVMATSWRTTVVCSSGKISTQKGHRDAAQLMFSLCNQRTLSQLPTYPRQNPSCIYVAIQSNQ